MIANIWVIALSGLMVHIFSRIGAIAYILGLNSKLIGIKRQGKLFSKIIQ